MRSIRIQNTYRQAFTLIELLVVIAIIALLVGILLPVMAGARKAGRESVCLQNLKSQGNAMGTFAADRKGAIAQFDWKARRAYTIFTPTGGQAFTAATDMEAASGQMTDIIRRYSGQNGATVPLLGGATFPYPQYGHLAMIDYLSGRLPELGVICPEDRVQQELSAKALQIFVQGMSGGNTDPGRGFRNSYTFSPGAFAPDRDPSPALQFRPGPSQGIWAVPRFMSYGGKKFADITFPSQKVLMFEEFSRHQKASVAFYTHRSAIVPTLLADSSVRSVKAIDSNPGGALTSNGGRQPLFVTYVADPQWSDPPWPDTSSTTQPIRFGYTLGGLKGIDFGSKEPF